MSRLQRLSLVALAFACALLFCSKPSRALIQTQQDQIAVTIVVNVTPAPLGYVPAPGDSSKGISARFALRARGSQDAVDSTKMLDFTTMVAQSVKQGALKVEAQVSPNPNATLLYSNQPTVAINGVAGTTVTVSCIYTVTVDTTKTAWTLRDGLSSNLAGNFPGSDIAHNTYLQGNTPQPAPTIFPIYPSNWANISQSGLMKTYCVDLSVTIPSSVAQGAYSTNAIYTLYY